MELLKGDEYWNKKIKDRFGKRKKREVKVTPKQKGTNPRAMSKRKSKAVTIGDSGDVCRVCQQQMVVKEHPETTPKLRKQHYYFSQLDYCRKCIKVFFDERFKIINGKGADMEELERQKSFIQSIK